MLITIRLTSPLRLLADGKGSLTVAGTTVGEVLEAATAVQPALRGRLFDRQGALRSEIRVYVNDDDLRLREGLATLLIAGVATYLLMHGLSRSRDAALALRAGLALAGCAVAKLLLFDLATLDGIVRIVAFLGAGLALLAMGTGYARALDRARQAP